MLHRFASRMNPRVFSSWLCLKTHVCDARSTAEIDPDADAAIARLSTGMGLSREGRSILLKVSTTFFPMIMTLAVGRPVIAMSCLRDNRRLDHDKSDVHPSNITVTTRRPATPAHARRGNRRPHRAR